MSLLSVSEDEYTEPREGDLERDRVREKKDIVKKNVDKIQFFSFNSQKKI